MYPERERIEKIIGGDVNEFRSFVEDYQRLVAHIVFRMVRNETDREEICQQVFVRVYENLRQFQGKSKLSTWIARIAYHTAINYIQKKKLPLYGDLIESESNEKYPYSPDAVDTVTSEQELPDEVISRRQRDTLLFRHIYRMPVRYRVLVTLFHLEEMSYKEISEIVNLPEGTVKNYLFRARKLLKDRLLQELPKEELWG